MGIFGRDKKDDLLNDWSNADSSGIDFSKYNLTSLGDDVRSIISLPDAMAQIAKWAFGIPIVIGILSWIVFSGRMSGWLFVPFVLGAMALSVLGSVFIGGFFVARKRLDTVSEATNRVVNVVGEIHRDVVQVKDGASSTSVKAVAGGLVEHAIFPMAFGVVEGMAGGGMFSSVTSRFTSMPMNLVQKSVLGAIDRLPDKEIGQVTSDLTSMMPDMSATLGGLNDEYQRIAGEIEGIVAGVSKATLGSVVGVAALSMVPLMFWLILGWLIS